MLGVKIMLVSFLSANAEYVKTFVRILLKKSLGKPYIFLVYKIPTQTTKTEEEFMINYRKFYVMFYDDGSIRNSYEQQIRGQERLVYDGIDLFWHDLLNNV